MSPSTLPHGTRGQPRTTPAGTASAEPTASARQELEPQAGPLPRSASGTVEVPDEVLKAAGIRPDDTVVFEADSEGVRLAADRLRRVYVEPTTRCNLDCVMCIRRAWAGGEGDMPLERLHLLLAGLPDAPVGEFSLVFAGYGEPLSHPDLFDMIRETRDRGHKVELITNGFRIDRATARELALLGVAQVTVSVDGGDEAAFASMRGAQLTGALAGIEALVDARLHTHAKMAIGVAAVATHRNVGTLPEVIDTARRLGLEFVSISNVVPHTAEMAAEALTGSATWASSFLAEGWQPRLRVARFDAADSTRALASAVWGGGLTHPSPHIDPGGWRDHCRFVREGMLAVSWDGRVAPCLSLLHTHPEHINGQTREVRSWTVGHVDRHPLREIWRDPAYAAFRLRVRAFDFPPCLTCGGCPLTETNEDDCYQTPFPSCGACLWAQGLVLCP